MIPKAIDKASTPEDYREINNLLTLKHLYDDYRTIIDFVDEITQSTLNHHAVVSFYINSDLNHTGKSAQTKTKPKSHLRGNILRSSGHTGCLV